MPSHETKTRDQRGRNPAVGNPNGDRSSSSRESGEPILSDDDVFEVLHNKRRRRVVEYLRENGETATAGELAEYIAAEENETTVQQLSSYERKRVYISLYQNHLPMMDRANVVDYDDGRKTVRLLEYARGLEPYLEDATEPAAYRTVMIAALAVAACVLLGSLQIGAFAAASASAWAVFGMIGLLGVAALKLHRHG